MNNVSKQAELRILKLLYPKEKYGLKYTNLINQMRWITINNSNYTNGHFHKVPTTTATIYFLI